MWTTNKTSGGSLNSEQHINHINITSSAYTKRPAAVSEQEALCHNVSSSQLPTVSFDLGNEWDDWGDFDDENLVHASESLLASTEANPQIQQCVEYNQLGREKFDYFVSLVFTHLNTM